MILFLQVRQLGPRLRAKGLSESEATKVIMKKLNIQKPKSRAYYRIDANRRMMGAQPLMESDAAPVVKTKKGSYLSHWPSSVRPRPVP